MKIEIDLQDRPETYLSQMRAVDQYIKENTERTRHIEFFSTTVASWPEIKTTDKFAARIELLKFEVFNVRCRKTKGGVYKFQVNKAV